MPAELSLKPPPRGAARASCVPRASKRSSLRYTPSRSSASSERRLQPDRSNDARLPQTLSESSSTRQTERGPESIQSTRSSSGAYRPSHGASSDEVQPDAAQASRTVNARRVGCIAYLLG